MENNLYGVHNWSGDLKRQQNTCFRSSQAAFFLLSHALTEVMQTDKKQLFFPQPQHWAVPLALHPLLKMWMLPAATNWSLHLCRAVLLSLALPQPSPRGLENWAPQKVFFCLTCWYHRALSSLCNSRKMPVMGFCSNSWALPCSPLLCEPHCSCSHCCHMEHHPSASVLKCC